ncbi:carbohydrate binding domain-containing protein [Mammaliicoccus sciuri]|uniref:carbohydrate binding domain-containing protein n=1 Tax=Mammaliicoccus sciuri TaxID=1296 RepID=UPI002B25A8FC|nr:carbohydrate binding domain-containing protein [Mammaliicoccus sciuri]WQL34208.1 carbohydrate binding domain-containing protein [Mammaliicoccus sciuri]WQL61147.1 carbohydrate binding domain-containing protein [Mammaliicoccus sciuri]
MALNKHFNVDTYEFEDRPKPKLWLLKPDFTRIERITGASKLQGTFKYNNLNQLSFQISPTMFDGFKHEQVKNTVFDKIRNKYIIEFKYNNYSDYMVIDDLKEVSSESESIQVTVDSLANELSHKSMNEIEMLGSTISQMSEELTKNYAPLWSLKYVDPKVKDVKRELTLNQGTVMSALEQINTLFDTVIIFDNKNRQYSFYHKDSVGTNRGLRIRENSYLKSFEDSMVSKDIITRLIPMGSEGLTIHSANPAGSDYIEDFSFFIKPFKRDANRNVIQHSDYMSDELCHALLDYDEFYESKKETIEEYTKRYSEILTQHAEEDFKLRSLNAIVQRQEDRIELLKPKSEYIDLGLKASDFSVTVAKSSYYILMLKNEGSLTNVKFDGKTYQLNAGEWTYIKIDTADFQDATQVDKKLKYKIELLNVNTRVHAVITRSSLDDYEETDVKKIEEKYNYLKYNALREEQLATVAVIERRMKQYENEKDDLIASMNPKLFLSDELYKEREQYIYSAIWQEDNHTDAKELYDDAVKQLKKQNNVTRAITVGIVNFIQSLEHKHDWDKLNVGDEIVFSNKFFDKKLKAYITEMQIGFDENSVQLTLSDVFDFKDLDTRISELIAETSSTSTQVNMHKEQIKESQGKITKMTELIEGEWDANKQRVLAGNETVDIGSHGIKVVSNENPNEFVIMVGGVIAMTKDGGETFKTGVTPDGVNAEMLIGKMIIGEDLWLENESGTMRFNKDGFHIDSSMFHLTTNDGDDYFENLKNKIQDDIKQQETRIKESYQRDIQNAIQESVDVENIINTATTVLQDTFADGIITDIEKKLINDTISSLEKENSEYVQQIELALNHPYISDDHIIELTEAYEGYMGMYDTLVTSIYESISDDVVTSDESTTVNDAIVNFRNEIQTILILVQEILETTRDRQLTQKIEQSLDFTTRMTADMKDEMADLNKAFKEAQETIDDAIKDGVVDAAETETIKTALMIMKSEKQDIENRYTQILANTKLSQTAKDRIVTSHNAYTLAFIDFNNYVEEMISDGIANSTEKENYINKFEKLNETSSKFSTDFTYALQVISLGYANDVEGKLTSQIDGMRTEITADLKDVSDNLGEFKDVTFEAFKDGILSDVELSRIKVHQEMLEREYKDVDAGYQSVSTNSYLSSSALTVLSQKRTAFTTAHGNLINLLNNILQVGKITASQKTQVSQGLTAYSTALAEYTKAMQSALDNISNNMASDIAAERVNSFSGVLDNIQGNINGLQSQVDNAIDTFYYGYVPTLSNYPSQEWTTNAKKDIHIGDFFLNTKTGVAYRFLKEDTTYLWKPIEDQVITDALNSAKTAQDTADGKRRVFVNTPIPPYDIGDMWVQGTSGDIMVCKVARGKNTSYVTTDWGKASKYTDDSKANQVLSDLNTFKTSANQNITNLNNTVNNFQTTVVDAFDDRVIEMAEASSINHSIQLLNNEKARIDRQYTTLVNNADLVGAPKTQLTTTYNAFVTASNSLIQTIQSAIADNKIVPTEKTAVDQKFVAYRTAITNLADKTNAAIDAIIRNVSVGEANKVNERFETWKSSEFLVESDKIAQRVSGSTWSSTYLPQVDDKINGIQIGGRNLLLKSNTFVEGTSYALNDYYTSYEIPEGTLVTLSFKATLGSDRKFFGIYNSGGMVTMTNIFPSDMDSNGVFKKTFRWTKVREGTSTIATNKFIRVYHMDSSATSKSSIEWMKLEVGNKATDWTPAPEDVDNKINNITVGANNLLLNSAFNKGTDNWRNVGDNTTPLSVNNSGSNPEFKKMAVIDRPDLSSVAEKGIAQDGINFEIGKDYILSAWVFLYSTTKTDEVFLQYGKSTFIREYTTLEIGKWTRVEMKFVADQNLANVYIGFRRDKIAAKMAVTGIQLVKGNYNTEWSPSPVEYETTIEANNSFIEQNKNQILSSVSKSEVEATLSKIATYETSYDIKSRAIKPLLEYNGVEFNDNYSYEVVAKTRYDGYETLAVATYISKGKGKGFDLTIIDEKGTTGAHPLFGIANNKPNITLYSSMVTQYTVDVIYTKYMGSASNIERTNSQIKQVSDNITLSVDKVHEELDLNNMLLNSDFTSGFEGWGYVQEIYTIADKKEMSINSDSNMILNGAYRTDYVGTTNYNRTVYNLSSPLKVGRQYTLSFEYSLTAGSNSNIIGLLPYVPEDTYYRINAAQNTNITFTFTATKSSTQILLYPADRNTPENNTAKATFSKVTLVEGEKPLAYKFGSSRNALKVNYNTNAGNYPSIISNFMNVGKGQEVSIGDELTLSAYIYVPSSAKNTIKNNIYFECATYENNKQSSNPAFMRYSLAPENIIYDTWVRYYVTGTVPETSANGKTNYLRALLRFNASSNTTTDGVLFYYGLPQLEKGNTLTRWTPAKLDALSTEGLATKIALNPESIEMISQNLNINTDVLTIKNTKGNFTMAGDTLTISDAAGNNQTKITASGISIKSDGTDKMLNGMDMAEWEVRPYEPQFATWNSLPAAHSAASSKYNGVQIVEPGRTGLYSITWGVYSFAKTYEQLIENNNTAYARVNRYTYVYNKRYLKIAFSATTTKGVNLIIRAMDSTGGIQMAYQKVVDTAYTYPVFIIDLQKSLGYKADNKVHYFELQAGLTTNSGYSSVDSGSFRITRMSMSDFNE